MSKVNMSMIFKVHDIYSPYESLLNKKPKYKIHVVDKWIDRQMDKDTNAQLQLKVYYLVQNACLVV